jgi:hypothetical protein
VGVDVEASTVGAFDEGIKREPVDTNVAFDDDGSGLLQVFKGV